MNHTTRPATTEDLENIQAIFDAGKAYLKSQGLPQWQNGHAPSLADAEPEVRAGQSYVLEVDGKVSGFASLIPGPDGSPELSEGAWDLRHSQYAAIHRVALDAAVRGRGLGAAFMRDVVRAAGERGYKDIRIDTHPGNKIMQKVVARAGFSYAGIMHLPIPDGERLAYQIFK